LSLANSTLTSYNQFMTMYVQNLGMDEVTSCPRCGIMLNPEYLTSITKTGLVVGCASCVSPAARRDTATLAQLITDALTAVRPAKAWM
jgi:hypothetical protein